MLTNNKERVICARHKKRDVKGEVHCFECPLRKGTGKYDFRCKANSSYNRKKRDWVYDTED